MTCPPLKRDLYNLVKKGINGQEKVYTGADHQHLQADRGKGSQSFSTTSNYLELHTVAFIGFSNDNLKL